MFTNNYKSALDNREKVEKQLLHEIENGRIFKVKEKPMIVNALGAIIKQEFRKVKTRLIVDCSFPPGESFNDLTTECSVSYDDIRVAREVVQRNDFMCKVDASEAFRAVNVAPEEWTLLGLQWTFTGEESPTYLVDSRMSFGTRRGPLTYQKLSKAITRIMNKAGFNRVLGYLDDWLILEQNYEDCLKAQNYLITLLRCLGLAVNFSKVEGPSRVINFLGAQIDTNSFTLSVPQSRIDYLNHRLNASLKKKVITKRELESVLGLMCWFAQFIPTANQYTRKLYKRLNCLKAKHHLCRVSSDVRADLLWWITCAKNLNSTSQIRSERTSFVTVATDATPESAGGIIYDGIMSSWIFTDYKSWGSKVNDLPIVYKEVLAVLPVFLIYAPWWRGKQVNLHLDNKPGVHILNKGVCKNDLVMSYLKLLGAICVLFDIKYTAYFYCGQSNYLADSCSRIKHPGGLQRWERTLAELRGGTSRMASKLDPGPLDNRLEYLGGHRIPL